MLHVFHLCLQILNKLHPCNFLKMRPLYKPYFCCLIVVYIPHLFLYLLFERKQHSTFRENRVSLRRVRSSSSSRYRPSPPNSVTFDRTAMYIGPFDRACFCLSKLSKKSNFVFGAVSRASSFHATYHASIKMPCDA